MGMCWGLRALVRWRHPDNGLISPAQFIGVAESSALIIPLGRWILEQACQQCHRCTTMPFSQHGRWRSTSVPGSFSKENFVDDVAEVLRATGASPRRLELELTSACWSPM